MQKGFGSSNKKKILKDSRYLRSYNDEKYAEHLLKNKNNKEAKNLYLKLLKSGYESYKIFFNLGFIELREKNHQEAINYLKKAKSLTKETNLNLLFGLVNSYISLKDIKEARFILDEAIQDNPKSELVFFNYAKIEEDLSNFNKAILLYEKGLKLDPENYKALSNLGGLYQKVKNYPNAIEVYKNAIKLQPNISHLKVSLLIAKAFACDWSDPENTKDLIRKIDIEGQAICPFAIYPFQDDPFKHMKRAEKFFEREYSIRKI